MKMLPTSQLLDFSNKVVLVTGGSSGIGAEISTRFAEAGADIVLHYRMHIEKAQIPADIIKTLGRRVEVIQADLTNSKEVYRLVQNSIDAFNKIDILINSAGIYPVSPIENMALKEWEDVLDINLKAVFTCIQVVSKRMVEQQTGGAIVNISSIDGLQPAFGHSHYSSAKAAVNMLTRQAAFELAKENIRVNTVSPGLIWKEGIEEEWQEGVRRWLSKVPLKRLGRPDDVADACLFLASPAASWITGANLLVDGGIMTTPIF